CRCAPELAGTGRALARCYARRAMTAALLLAAAFACPEDHKLQRDLKEGRSAVLAAQPGSDEQHFALAALRFQSVPGDNTPDADCADKPVLEGVDLFEASLTGEKDKLVQARFPVCKGDKQNETQALRIAVVVPLA